MIFLQCGLFLFYDGFTHSHNSSSHIKMGEWEAIYIYIQNSIETHKGHLTGEVFDDPIDGY